MMQIDYGLAAVIVGGTAIVSACAGFWAARTYALAAMDELTRRHDERLNAAYEKGKRNGYDSGILAAQTEHNENVQILHQSHADEIETVNAANFTLRSNAEKHHAETLDAQAAQHEHDISVIKTRAATELDAAVKKAYQEGKESDGMYRGNDGTGKMVSAKPKASTPVAVKAVKAPVKRAAKKACK